MTEPASTLDLTRTVGDPARARAFVRERLADLPEDVLYDATLVATELVTNVINHGQLPAHLEVHRAPRPRLVVRDHGPAFTHAHIRPADEATSGRGLNIIAALAWSWGVTAEADGKSVWAEVDPAVAVL